MYIEKVRQVAQKVKPPKRGVLTVLGFASFAGGISTLTVISIVAGFASIVVAISTYDKWDGLG